MSIGSTSIRLPFMRVVRTSVMECRPKRLSCMSPEDIHKLAGLLVAVILLPLIAAEAGGVRGAWMKYVIPVGVLALGLYLVLDPIVFHGGDFGAEGVQHQIQGAGAIAASGIELVRARGRLQARGWGLVLPLGILAIGILFAAHTQHGAGAMRAQLALHRILGATVIGMAALRAIDVMGWARGNWARVGWLLFGLMVVAQLFLYAEDPMPAGAHGAAHGGH
jgi:hypothetical protein